MMILEMTAYYKKKGMTLSDALSELYNEYGFYTEKTIDIYMEGLNGIEKRRRIMSALRSEPPYDFGGVKVAKIGDFKDGTVLNVADNRVDSTGQPSSDVLYYTLENGDKIIVRPSGTEPKIKIYILAHGESEAELSEKIKVYETSAKKISNL